MNRKGLIVRSVGWACLWLVMNPQLTSVQFWHQPEQLGILLIQYIVSSVILELTYRWLSWGSLYPNKKSPVELLPECPEHPWIDLDERKPSENEDIEVFCADGIVRKGAAMPRDSGSSGLVVQFSKEDLNELRKKPELFRPTHWRLDIKDEEIF